MSKKSKKILAYLMFVAALCGTPAVSEARGGSGGQVKTEKASGAQRGGNLSESIFSYFVRNYGPGFAKAMFYGGGGFGTAKVLKAGDLSTWASYLLNLKDAKSKDAEKLMNQFKQEKEKFENEKSLFEQSRAKALNDNTKLNNEKVALELSNNKLDVKVKENEQKIKELENSKEKLNNEVLNLKSHNNQLLNLNNEDNKKIDALLSGFLPYKMSGEFVGTYDDNRWVNYGDQLLNLDPYSNSQNSVNVAFVNYDQNFDVVGDAQNLELGVGNFFDEVDKKAKELLGQDATNTVVALKDVDLGYCGIPRLARCSFIVMGGEEGKKLEKVVAAYFPVKSFQLINNVENDENNEENNENNENIENNGNVNN
jgi:hypothetical protein